MQQLERIRGKFSTPEDIDDSPDTAPSKRIEALLPRYRKRIDGPLLAQTIGLETIRLECPRFREWMQRLEHFGAPRGGD